MNRLNVGKLMIARDLIRKGHSVNAYARDGAGAYVQVKDPAAKSFCALGAIGRVLGGLPNAFPYIKELERASKQRFGIDVVTLNDRPRGKAKVLAVYDAIIKQHSR